MTLLVSMSPKNIPEAFGYNKPLDSSFIHDMSGVSLFFEDFNKTLSVTDANSKWDLTGAPGQSVENGYIKLPTK
jgi:hypothetical protein